MKNSIKSYSHEELVTLMASLGQPKFRAKQIVKWLYGEGAASYDEMTDLPKSLRETLSACHPILLPTVVNRQISQDGTRKYVLEYTDGSNVETVAIPSGIESSSGAEGSSDNEKIGRLTVCVSTQVGCAMECVFCATGKEGYTRNLLPGEIIDQIQIVQADMGTRVSNLVTMGQGEPFLNYKNTLAALRFANSPDGLAIGARHITISTCGVIKGIRQLASEPEQFTLALSLHSALQDIRDTLMPKSAASSLHDVRAVLLEYTKKTNRRVSLEYIMIKDVNDTPDALEALRRFCSGLLCHVNLLPLNSILSNESVPSSRKTVETWAASLENARIPVTIRKSRGADIAGACGQLKNAL